MLKSMKRIRDTYHTLIQGKGFALVATICVAIITGSAVWTQNHHEPYTAPTAPVVDDRSAAVQMQESLHSQLSPTPLPSQNPVLYQMPLDKLVVITGYSDDTFSKSGDSSIWSVHAGVDLKADTGAPVRAMADGIVARLKEDDISGISVELDHSDGVRTCYSGLSMISALHVNDRVRSGQTIGYAGNGPVGENSLGPHLHLEAFRDDHPIDPLLLID